MLQDQDKIFTNLYGYQSASLPNAKARGDWKDTTDFVKKGSDWLIEQTKASGLRGRGGAGFPVGLKWSFAPKKVVKPHYLVINANSLVI